MATTKLVQHSGRFYGHIYLTLSVYVACVSGSEWVLSFVNIENAAALTPKRIRSNSDRGPLVPLTPPSRSRVLAPAISISFWLHLATFASIWFGGGVAT